MSTDIIHMRLGFCHDSAIHKMPDEKFDIIMKMHNYTPFRMIRALSSHWMNPQYQEMPKTIVNVSSTSGLHGSMGQINYATAKAGITGLTKTVASEWSRYVSCHNQTRDWIVAFLVLIYASSSIDTTFARMPWHMVGSIPALPNLRLNRKYSSWTDRQSVLGFRSRQRNGAMYLISPWKDRGLPMKLRK